ncbi:hypothetical protein [Aliarcobacter butzleri]|uniref:hypothetical protein n=1 Tax=Aliarcobacter butzleri TaxID=28197 RepID=UPI0021B3DDA6|nr:hypothetical protein [Aliarcobacter butzleri]MCT7567024.1 hypothetical protein [Aliarcobacter butzleri]
MARTEEKAKQTLILLQQNNSVKNVIEQLCSDENEWHRVSSKAYALHLKKARKQLKEDEKKSHVICTSNDEIKDIIKLNSYMADFALSFPTIATMTDYKRVQILLEDMPNNETTLLALVEEITMNPRIRALQKKGRFEHFQPFIEFVDFIEAATLCYFRGNYISSYLTLVPIAEGIILRWLGYSGQGKKPDFETIRKFFSNSHTRQPCPSNPLFHEVYTKVCDKIFNEHLYKPSEQGQAYANFNRHLAAHLLDSSQFTTKENCIRLFLLIDTMTELYYYETYCSDPRFYLTEEHILQEFQIYKQLLTEQVMLNTPEKKLLKSL